MTKTITLQDADRSFARCIQDVEAGEDILITRDGKPVARLSPAGDHSEPIRRREALEGLKAIMNHGWRLALEPFDRDASHER